MSKTSELNIETLKKKKIIFNSGFKLIEKKNIF